MGPMLAAALGEACDGKHGSRLTFLDRVRNHDEMSDSSLSSVPSMGRQMTELSEAHCTDIMERQLSSFQSRSTEFWRRQCTAPTDRQRENCLEGLRRQISCPTGKVGGMDVRARGFTTLAPIQAHDDLNSEDNSTDSNGFQSRFSSQACPEDELEEGLIETAISVVVTECTSSVLVADPGSLDSDLIAISDGFVDLTHFSRDEVIGENCRFLNEGCPPMPQAQRQRLARCCETGEPFTAVLVNRRKTGEFFLNLLDMRGLILARSEDGLEHLWVLIACQQDVTHMDREQLPTNHIAQLRQVANRIRKRLLKQLNELGLAGAMFRVARPAEDSGAGSVAKSGSFALVTDLMWRIGVSEPDAVSRSLDLLPDLHTFPLLQGERLRLASVEPPVGVRQVHQDSSSGEVKASSPNREVLDGVGERACGEHVAEAKERSFAGRPDAERAAGKLRLWSPPVAAAFGAAALLMLLAFQRRRARAM